MKKLQIILLSLLTVSLITYCPASSSGNPPPVDNTMRPPVDNMMPPPVDNMMPPPADVNTVKTIHAHVNDDVDNAEVVALSDSITVTEPTYSILEGNDANIFSINSSTGVITLVDASKVTYDAETKSNNIHLLKVRVRNGSDTTKATEAPLRIVVRGFGGAFITTWTVEDSDKSITIPIFLDGYDFRVNWGDMSPLTTHKGDATTAVATHTYEAAKTYTVIITGTFPRIAFDLGGVHKAKLQTVEQWGSVEWMSMINAFSGANNLTVTAVDAPNLTGVISMQSMFQGATTFNQDISHWDTSNIEDMTGMFTSASDFNQNINDWNTEKVANMASMFSGATNFNQDISKWNTAKVTNMSAMFNGASAFNQNIGSWDTGEVTNMSNMFNGASAFNQNIGNWNTAKVTDMLFMFFNATAFNQDIREWNVSKVTSCGGFAGGSSGLTDPMRRPNFMNLPDCSP